MALKKQLKEVKAKIIEWQQYAATNWIGKMYRSHQIGKYEYEKEHIEQLLKDKKGYEKEKSKNDK
jgi:hypothetical protein